MEPESNPVVESFAAVPLRRAKHKCFVRDCTNEATVEFDLVVRNGDTFLVQGCKKHYQRAIAK